MANPQVIDRDDHSLTVDPGEPARLDSVPALDPDVKKRDPEKVIEKILSRFERYKDWRNNNMDEMWERTYKAYMGITPNNKGPYRTNVVIRECFRQQEVLKSQMSSQFFDNTTQFKYLPKHAGFEGPTDAATNIIHDQIAHLNNGTMVNERQKWLDNATMYGTSFLCYGWQHYRHTQLKQQKIFADIGSKDEGKSWWEQTTEEVEEEGPNIRWLNHYQVYSHPFVEDPRNSPFVFFVEEVSKDYIKTLIREGFLDAKACKEIGEDEGIPAPSSNDRVFPDIVDDDPRLNTSEDGDDCVEMMTCWSNDGWEYVIINQTILARGQRCYYGGIPVLVQRNFPKPNELYGIPEALVIMGEQAVLNDLMGMLVDVYHFTSNPMFLVPEGSMKYFKKPGFQPGGIIPYTEKMGKPELLQVSPLEQNIMANINFVRSNMQLASGVTPELAGTGSAAKTATQHVSLRDAAGERMRHKVRLFMPAFRELYLILFKLNAAFASKDYAVRMEGEDGGTVFAMYGPDVFNHDVDVEVELSNETEQGPEAAMKWSNAMNVIFSNPATQGLADPQYFLEKYVRALGEKYPKRALVNPTLSQSDAMDEYQNWISFGILPEPKMSDNHQKHLEMMNMQERTPEWQAAAQSNPAWLMFWQRHKFIHQQYVEAQQQQAAMQAQQQAPQEQMGGNGQPTGPVAGNMAAEAMFSNGAVGAASQGGLVA